MELEYITLDSKSEEKWGNSIKGAIFLAKSLS